MSDIILIGKPNSGKSLLFNRLSGLKRKVANYPGATVQINQGKFNHHTLKDFPGVYSFEAMGSDEELAIAELMKQLKSSEPSLIVCNLDATRLERSLVFGLSAQNLCAIYQKGFIFTLNMCDELEQFKFQCDLSLLELELGSPVFAISAKTGKGLELLKNQLSLISEHPENFIPATHPAHHSEIVKRARDISLRFSPSSQVTLSKQNQIDNFLLNHFLGGPIFIVIMAILFQSIFTWATPLMDFVENALTLLSDATLAFIPQNNELIRSFMADGIFGGLGGFLVFVPQIFILSFLIGALEDSGYLARAALICHRPMALFGLSGKSFIPYLTGHACAIPAIFAARNIEDPIKRKLTILTVPFMSCSARLPVYTLLIHAIIPNHTFWGGLVGTQGIALLLLYIMGMSAGLLSAKFLDFFSNIKFQFQLGFRFKNLGLKLIQDEKFKGQSQSNFIQELPPYRLPRLLPLFHRGISYTTEFIKNAGPMIFAVIVVIWFLAKFPAESTLESSYLGDIGKFFAPLFAPFDLDWKYTVAIITSFLAREVFVGTLGTLHHIENADENLMELVLSVQSQHLSLASGVALLIFYVLSMQCVSTLATMKKELGENTSLVKLFIIYNMVAYVAGYVGYFVVNIF